MIRDDDKQMLSNILATVDSGEDSIPEVAERIHALWRSSPALFFRGVAIYLLINNRMRRVTPEAEREMAEEVKRILTEN